MWNFYRVVWNYHSTVEPCLDFVSPLDFWYEKFESSSLQSPFTLLWCKLKRCCNIHDVKNDQPRNLFFLVRLKSPFSFFKIDVLNSHNCGSLAEQISGTWNEFERYEKPRFPCKNISNTFLIEISTRFHLMMISGRKRNKKTSLQSMSFELQNNNNNNNNNKNKVF